MMARQAKGKEVHINSCWGHLEALGFWAENLVHAIKAEIREERAVHNVGKEFIFLCGTPPFICFISLTSHFILKLGLLGSASFINSRYIYYLCINLLLRYHSWHMLSFIVFFRNLCFCYFPKLLGIISTMAACKFNVTHHGFTSTWWIPVKAIS